MNWIKNTALFLCSILFSLIVLEVGMRFVFPDKLAVQRDHSDPLMPRQSAGALKDPAFGSTATFDSIGLRVNPNNCADAVDRRILIVGDSNIAALFLNDGLDLSAQLAQLLNETGCVIVDSFGVAGYGPDQSLFAATHLLKAQHYDDVIFHIFADNDAGDLLRNNFPLENGRLTNTGYCHPNRSFLDRLVLPQAGQKLYYAATGKILDWHSLRHSLGEDARCLASDVTTVGSQFDQLQARAVNDLKIKQANGAQAYMNDRFDVEFACQSSPVSHQIAMSKMSTVVQGVLDLATEKSFNPMFLLQPSEFDVTANHADLSQDIQTSCPNYAPTNNTDFFVQAIGEKVAMINLYDAFSDCGDCFYTMAEAGGDNHWNAYGIGVAAKELATVLAR
ncbi:MAG: hypothetical protein P8Q99_15815 [Paracoccaceae bacterium]|nr:hypothetical protein [Paracoccaceae bacterium]